MINVVNIQSFPITLAQFLKFTGLALTGGEAKEIVHSGIVEVNGLVCTMPGKQLQPGDSICILAESGQIEYLLKSELLT